MHLLDNRTGTQTIIHKEIKRENCFTGMDLVIETIEMLDKKKRNREAGSE